MSNRARNNYLAVVIALITFAVYLPALRNGFVCWDDDIYVYRNPNIWLLNAGFIRWAFSSFYASNWHPLTWISHALDFAMWGPEPMGHHLVNIIIHAVNTCIVVVLCVKLMEIWKNKRASGRTKEFPDGRGALIAAGVTGLLFGIHPLHVESVAWISERKDLLCGLFYLLSVTAYIHYVAAQVALPRQRGCVEGVLRGGRGWYLLSLAFFVLALLSKPMAVTLPLVLLLLDWYPLRRFDSVGSFKMALMEKLPFVAMSTVSSVLTIMAQRTEEAMTMLEAVPLWARLLVAGKALISYLRMMIFPVGLSPYYPYPTRVEVLSFMPRYLLAVILVVGVTIAVSAAAKKQKIWLSVWMYYLLTLLPVIGLVQVGLQSMADRYVYLPSIGPFFILGVGTARLWYPEGPLKGGIRSVRVTTAIMGMCLLLALSYLTLRQIDIWKNGLSLWSYAIDEDPGSALAYNNRALALREKGDYALALSDLDKALSLGPPRYLSELIQRNRGRVLEEEIVVDRAIQEFKDAVKLAPDNAKAYADRGAVFGKIGQYSRAIEDFSKAIVLDAAGADGYVGRGLAFMETGQFNMAMRDFNSAISLDPSSVDAYLNRGVAFERMDRLDRALADYDKAVSLAPSDYLAFINRAMLLARTGATDRAIEDYTTAISLYTKDAKPYLGRGNLYMRTGRIDIARQDFKTACDLGSEDGCEALRNNSSHEEAR